MKKTTTMMLCLAAACACGDTKITWLADVTADRAETVTGVQSGQVAAAAAHINRTDNPHGVTAAQVGALTAEQDLAALRTYHYGSPDIVESPAEWFGVDGAGTITAFNWAAGRENVVIPWEIGGVPVTAIGEDAFRVSGIVSLIAPQTVTMIGNYAFYYCVSLTSINLPQVASIGMNGFGSCTSLTSVSLPQAQTVGAYAFSFCYSLASVSLPQATAIGNAAFYGCTSLTSVHMGQNAPVQATDVFANITPPPTVYVTNPQATGWGAVWNGAPVVRPPLYGSNVTAQAFTLGGDTITEWPAGGGETSIIAPLIASGTNVTVTSTQSVYSVSVTGAGPVGIDWSGLALDGTGRAEVTLRLNVTEWGGTNVTFAPALMFDRTPEILVTGVWEFAASTIDGVTTRVRQTWPETGAWTHMMRTFGSAGDQVGTWASFAGGGVTNHAYFNLPNTGLHYVRMRPRTAANGLSGTYWLVPLAQGNGAINLATAVDTNVFSAPLSDYTIALDGVIDGSTGVALVGTHTPSYGVNARYRDCLYRPLNANERAAYAAGWRP